MSNTTVNQKDIEEKTVILSIMEWTKDLDEAIYWYENIPIPAFGHKTAKQTFDERGYEPVKAYMEHLKSGGFA